MYPEPKTTIYEPPSEGLPYLAVVFMRDSVDATPCETRADAEAYLSVTKAGLASDAVKLKSLWDS